MRLQSLVVIEMFSSIQGEGKYVGCRQVFVRLAGCNLTCTYCDTPFSRQNAVCGQIETNAGSRIFDRVLNPMTVEAAVGHINRLLTLPHHSVVLLVVSRYVRLKHSLSCCQI